MTRNVFRKQREGERNSAALQAIELLAFFIIISTMASKSKPPMETLLCACMHERELKQVAATATALSCDNY